MRARSSLSGQASVEVALLFAICAIALIGGLSAMNSAVVNLWPRIELSAGATTPVATSPPTPTAMPTTLPTATVAATPSPTPTVAGTPSPTPSLTPCQTVTVSSGPSVTLAVSGTKHAATISWTASVASAGQVIVSKANQSLSSQLPGSPLAAGSGTSHSATATSLNSGTYQYQIQTQDVCTGSWVSDSASSFAVP